MPTFFTERNKTREKLPTAVYVLGFAIFAQGTSELMLAGLLPDISQGLHVSIPHAGLLISGFAVGMLVGAPVLGLLARRWPRRRALLVFLAVFALAHAAGAMAPDYPVLLVTRVAAAFVYAGFWAVGSATVVELVSPQARGRAMGLVAGGLTVATVIGLPVGTMLGQYLGWRAVFWAVAALSVAAAAAVLATIGPPPPPSEPRLPAALRPELRALASPRLWLSYAVTALATSAVIVTFSYLSPLLTRTAGIAARWVPAVLALYGLGALAGIAVGGRTADRCPAATLYAGIGGVAAVLAALALTARQPTAAIVLVTVLGFTGFATNPTLSSRPFALVSAAPTLVAALNVSAFNTGITVGPWLGGLAIDHHLGYSAVAWTGAGLAVLALIATAAALRSPRPVSQYNAPSASIHPCKETS